MNKPFPRLVRHPVYWTLGLCLVILTFALTACGDSGSANATTTPTATPAPAASVTVKESKGSSGDVYTCDPTSITIHKGDTVSFTNQTDEIQNFDQGDAQKAGVAPQIALNQSVTVTFNVAGTFTIKSEKGATITVTVQ